MKGDKEIIDKLKYLLEGELTAINQYMLHTEMCEDWGYEKLSKDFKNRGIREMHHAEHLMERILFLEGKPIVSNCPTSISARPFPSKWITIMRWRFKPSRITTRPSGFAPTKTTMLRSRSCKTPLRMRIHM